VVLLATTLGPPELAAQMLPDGAPVMDFKLHGFGEDGYKIWELQGSQGYLVSEDLIEVIGMRLRLFSGGADLRPDFVMESPMADMRLSANTAGGEHGIRISGDHFLVEGEHWQWRHDVRRIRIERGVRVTFREKLEDILR
jgi:hypothetical protein